MLIDEETEARIVSILKAIAGSFSVYMIGRDLGQSTFQALASALTSRKMTFLEQSYFAGKVAALIGTDKLKTMTTQQVEDWIIQNNVSLTRAETATVNSLRRNTERWLTGRSESWQQKFRAQMSKADTEWRGILATSTFTDAAAKTTARNQSLYELMEALKNENVTFESEIDRLIQTEMNTYFQHGQISQFDGDEEVYKIPRATACPHCLRIHLEKDGSPRIYKLRDVIGNANWGKKAGAWSFTIGPTHPYCYCILYRVSDRSPRKSRRLSNALLGSLKKSIERPSLSNHCGVSESPDTTYEEVLLKGYPHHDVPAHVVEMIAAIRSIYQDQPVPLEEQTEQS